MTDIAGPAVFARFAFPPNSHGYCGPADSVSFLELTTAGAPALEEVRHVIPAFQGAWPYLDLIGACTGRDPLDSEVVEAYWLGNPLLERVDLLTLGNSMADRFRARAGWSWEEVSAALNAGGRATHAFHVFCIYPWVGLLQSGIVEQALDVLDNCRIRWGEVVSRVDDRLLVRSRPLTWDGNRLRLGPSRVESVLPPAVDVRVEVGDVVAMHWNYVCQPITPQQQRRLEHYHDLHLGIVNDSGTKLASRVER